MAPHFMMELSLHLLCGVQNAFKREDVMGGSLTRIGLLVEPIEVVNGIATPTARPGHGFLFDQEALARHRPEPHSVRISFNGGSE